MPIEYFIGADAVSDFRRRKLSARLRDAGGSEIRSVRQFFAAELALPIGESERRRLAALVDGAALAPTALGADVLLVTPRQGTLSPWSSKATDIARRCGLDFLERLERGRWVQFAGPVPAAAGALLHDPMTEQCLTSLGAVDALFEHASPRPLRRVPLSASGRDALEAANRAWGLALSGEEIAYLEAAYRGLGRDPTDAELMMFAQANSEHCRHKIFNATWTIDARRERHTLFAMIKASHQASPEGVLTAYADNAAVIEGGEARRWFVDPHSGSYRQVPEASHVLIKVETHNHPTAISPHPGAATGSGGEIRDEAATGRGGRPKAGLTGFSVSHLRIPGRSRPWEDALPASRPERLASSLQIMLEGPIGAASYNNEFGRPALAGYFRTLEIDDPVVPGLRRGYHKPIMIAGGMGAIRPGAVRKARLAPGDPVVVLGGPAMLIGLGGGAASSMASGSSSEDLDFASVQRDNPEMQRRCQEVIDRCCALGADNPIVAIHDVGAGGLSNAIPELLEDSRRGGRLELRRIPSADGGLSPMELWCNESQERYVLGVHRAALGAFEAICRRERCPFAVLGEACADRELCLDDELAGEPAVDLPLSMLFGATPRLHRRAASLERGARAAAVEPLAIDELLDRVLAFPAVASKKFLVTIGDRSVGGLVARDQLVGPWQVPVADAAVTLADFEGYRGEAMAMGERTPLALLDAPASGRMAVGEALTNLVSAPVTALGDVKLSANWMAAAGSDGDDADLFATVRAVGAELCPELGLSIPVGKDSLSMRTQWEQDGEARRMTAPVSLVVSAFAPVDDVRGTLTPQLDLADADAELVLLDLGRGRQRMGGSAANQVRNALGAVAPDLERPRDLVALYALLAQARAEGLLLACHDRSDGGLVTTLLEMAFAARCGLEVRIPPGHPPEPFLFNEELGLVLQLRGSARARFTELCGEHGLRDCLLSLGRALPGEEIRCLAGDGRPVLARHRAELERRWAETSYAMQALRDDPDCAREELEAIDRSACRLAPVLGFDPAEAPAVLSGAAPRLAVLREQGVNGHLEMAAAFHRAGFEAVDVHMSDLAEGRLRLGDFQGLAACGGFSFGDVLGAGRGWARSILFSEALRAEFAAFFARPDRFALGVCNGCQAFAALAELIPGAEGWPRFERNRSDQFEARLSLVEILDSPSVLLQGMAGSRLPVVVSHGEGRAVFPRDGAPDGAAVLRYVDATGRVAERYPENPNGSPGGVAGVCGADGRVTIMMPHPERVFRTVQFSWAPADWPEQSPWLRMFVNARRWLDQA